MCDYIIRTKTIRIESASGSVIDIYHQVFYNIFGDIVDNMTGWFVISKSADMTVRFLAKSVFVDNEFYYESEDKVSKTLLVHTDGFEMMIDDVIGMSLVNERY